MGTDYVARAEAALNEAENLARREGVPPAQAATILANAGRGWAMLAGLAAGVTHAPAPQPHGAPAGGAEGYPPCRLNEKGQLQVQCPTHGWGGRMFGASQGKPACVKCTRQLDDGSYCETRVPLDVAQRLAGVA